MVGDKSLTPENPLRPGPEPRVTLLGNVQFSVEVKRGNKPMTVTLEVSPRTALALGAGLIECCEQIAAEMVRADEQHKVGRVLQGGH